MGKSLTGGQEGRPPQAEGTVAAELRGASEVSQAGQWKLEEIGPGPRARRSALICHFPYSVLSNGGAARGQQATSKPKTKHKESLDSI